VGESSQVVNTNKGKRIVVYNGNELEEDGEKTYEFDSAISSEDDTNNITFDDSEDERALRVEDEFKE
jgi:hypothetical protein